MALLFKACPRCKGDLVDGGDQFGQYVSCLQCGFMRDAPQRPIGQLRELALVLPGESHEI